VYIDLNTKDYGGFVQRAESALRAKLELPAGYTYKCQANMNSSSEPNNGYNSFCRSFSCHLPAALHGVSLCHRSGGAHSPNDLRLTGGLILQKLLGYNFSVAVWVGYIALFGIAVETGVVMVVYLHEALNRRLATGQPLKHEDIEAAVIEGAVHRLRPKLMTVCVVLASLVPILWESGWARCE